MEAKTRPRAIRRGAKWELQKRGGPKRVRIQYLLCRVYAIWNMVYDISYMEYMVYGVYCVRYMVKESFQQSATPVWTLQPSEPKETQQISFCTKEPTGRETERERERETHTRKKSKQASKLANKQTEAGKTKKRNRM